jgi:hypothetical protein
MIHANSYGMLISWPTLISTVSSSQLSRVVFRLRVELWQCSRAACCVRNFDLQSRWPVPRVFLPFTHVCIHVKGGFFYGRAGSMHVNSWKSDARNWKKCQTPELDDIADILQIMDDDECLGISKHIWDSGILPFPGGWDCESHRWGHSTWAKGLLKMFKVIEIKREGPNK